MLSEIRRAIIARLTGRRVDTVSDSLKNMGLEVKLAEQHKGNRRLRTFEVPVFPHSLDGTGSESYPAIAIYFNGTKPRMENFVLEKIHRPVDGSSETVTFAGGATAVRPGLELRRDHPTPRDVTFLIKIDTRHEDHIDSIYQRLVDVFWIRGYLDVTLSNGEIETYDTLMEDPVNLPDPDSVFSSGESGYSMVVPFTVEAYDDNSATEEMVGLINKRELETPLATYVLDVVIETD